MKKILLIIFLLNVAVAQAQQIKLKGSVIDAQTNQPVASATISIVEKKIYYPTDNSGKFEIASDKLSSTDSVAVSCISYQTQKIKIDDMKPGIIIKLSSLVNMLKGINISFKEPVLIKLGNPEQHSSHVVWQYPGLDLSTFIEGSKNVKGTIHTVGFYLTNGRHEQTGNVTAPFRIRLFKVDTNGMPGKEITKEIIIVSAKNEGWFDIDISAYRIQNPDSGVFVAFTLLNYDNYKLKTGCHIPVWGGVLGQQCNWNDVIAPRLMVAPHKPKQPRSYRSIYNSGENMTWHWVKDYYDQTYMIRASIAPETDQN